MNVRDLRPRTVGELLDASFNLYRRAFARLVLASILASVPTVVLAALLSPQVAEALVAYTSAIQQASRPSTDPFQTLSGMMSAYGGMLWTSVIAVVLQALSRAATGLAMAHFALAGLRREPTPTLRAVARATWTRLPAAVLMEIAFEACWQWLWCCCAPLGVFLGVVLAPAPAILALERGPSETSIRASMPGPLAAVLAPFGQCMDAFLRGLRLTWRPAVVGRGTILVFVLLTFVGIFVAAVTTPLAMFSPASGHWFWVQHCAEMLFLPALGLGRALWYFDLLARREGTDLEAAA